MNLMDLVEEIENVIENVVDCGRSLEHSQTP